MIAIRNRDIHSSIDSNGTVTVKIELCGKIINVPGEGAVRDGQLKRARQARIITIPKFAHHAIIRRQQFVGHHPDTLLFATSTGRARSVSNIERLLRTFRNDNKQAIVEELGIPLDEFTWKLFRRTAATIVDEDGGIALASSLLGHASQQTTERHYRVRHPEVNPQTATILDLKIQSGV